MAYYFHICLFRGGCFELPLWIINIVVWGYGVFSLIKRKPQTAFGMVELMWLIAPLRVCFLTLFSFVTLEYFGTGSYSATASTSAY